MFNKIFKYILNKPLYKKYYQPLDPPSLREQKLIDDLKNTFKKLSNEDAAGYSYPERIWKQNINDLRELVLTDNPREFLRWDVISGTMFVGNEDYVVTELNHLRGKPDWKERWEKAIEEVETGFPIRFKKYLRSSGNLIHHAYHVSQFEEKTGVSSNQIDFICEFGGGYGCMCKLFHNLGFNGKYVIYDFPHFSALQEYFLKTVGITVHAFDNFQSQKTGVTCVSDIDALKDILSTSEGYSNSLFIAMWSISETPLHIKNSILPLVSHFDSILISYQDKFVGMDNLEYFETYKSNYEHEIQWDQWEIKHLPGNTYLIGTRNPHKLSTHKVYITPEMTFDEAIHSNFLYRMIKKFCYKKEYRKWTLSGKPIPPPHMVKQIIVKAYAAQFGINIFVETGTYLGEMVGAVKYNFKRIYSIELSHELYENARKKFSKHKHISIVNGDSAEVLPEILKYVKEPCLFWLDGHYSGGNTAKGKKETPIMEELKQICAHPVKNHLILIDDAREFTGQNDYPTIESLWTFIGARLPGYEFDVQDDIIRIYKKL